MARVRKPKPSLASDRLKRGLPVPTRPEPVICECCYKQPSTRLALDHCHVTGKFRGWLCSACNVSIGALGDDLRGVLNAVRYLQSYG